MPSLRQLKNKVATFREEIIESNKGKVRETLEQYLQVLEEQLSSHHCFLQKIMPEFEKMSGCIQKCDW